MSTAITLCALVATLAVAPSRCLAQVSPPKSPSGPSPASASVTAIEPCSIAPVDQLRFVMAAGLGGGRAVPIVRNASDRIAVSALTMLGATCSPPPLRADLQARIDRWGGNANGPARDSASATVRFTVGAVARVTYYADTGRTLRTPANLGSAALCLDASGAGARGGGVNVVRIEAPPVPSSFDAPHVRAWLGEALREECFDITSLVYVFLHRGGTVPPSP